jgi:hypothetical protein
MRLVFLTFWDRLNHKLNLFNRILERHHRVDWHPQMSNNYAVANSFVANRHISKSFQGEGRNPSIVAVIAHPIGINERCARASEARNVVGLARNDLGDDWRLNCGFIGHDGFPYVRDEKREAWTRR